MELGCVQSDTKRVEKNKNISQLIQMEAVETTNECVTSSSTALASSRFNVLTCASVRGVYRSGAETTLTAVA